MKTKTSQNIIGYNTCLCLLLAPLLIGLLAGCASTKVSDRQQMVTGKIPRPATIWVYDFANTATEVPMKSAFVNKETAPQSASTAEMNRQVGSEIASELVKQINAMGMPAQLAAGNFHVAVNDLMIQGYLLTVDEGSATKRVLIGFGDGASKLVVAVEGYQMTQSGMRKLGGGTVDAGGAKSPGAALGAVAFLATENPAGLMVSGGMHIYGEKSGKSTVEGRAKQTATEIANVLKQRFQEQGWIN